MGSLINKEVAVVVVPFPAQGHLNQLLQLSCLIASFSLPVHFVGSTIHNRQAMTRSNGLNPLDLAKLQIHNIPTPPFLSPSPNPNTSNKFPAHLLPSWEASVALREPVAAILKDISSTSRRIVIIHDPLMSIVVQDAASIQNAESYVFNPISAFTYFFTRWESLGKPPLIDMIPEGLPRMEVCIPEEVKGFVASQYNHLDFQVGNIYNSSRIFEGTYLDLLTRDEFSRKKKQWALGPILPVKLSSTSQHKCLEWLDKQEKNSVLYVAFGTTASMSEEEVRELAMGLEQSKSKFIWVLRDADKGDVFNKEVRKISLPEKFEENVEGYGIIVRDWAPQLEILAHQATGGFMSHCGWNSCLESITMGVPIAAWPMHSDQAWNSVLIAKVMRVGIVVREFERHEDLVASSTIADRVKKLMASHEGDEIRKRAEEMGDAVRKSTEEGGVSHLELEAFIAHITR
uniref:Glycosyltransferase n=1 Tax=Nemophila menziesii TaxID=79376 RepID=A0A387II12_NEMME|nr:glucosyltransferase 1 [Nemophila menziesii]